MLWNGRLPQLSAALLILAVMPVWAIDWPKDYVVHDDSASPDGQYGLIVPNEDNVESEGEYSVNYLANLKTRQVLGKIEGADYFEHQNHRLVQVKWAADSKWCVATYWDRYGFGSIFILELKDSTFMQIEIGERVQKALDGAMKKQSRDKEMRGEARPYFRLGPGRKVRVRALAQNNPKGFDNVKTYYALFQGTYDLDSKKWAVTDTRSITSDQNDALETAYDDIDRELEQTEFPSEQDKFETLDQRLNAVYQAAQYILPPARFATVKQEQRDWLNKRHASRSVEEKNKMTVARIKSLQDFVW